MYSRNYIYIKKESQQVIKNAHILIAGCGLGSVIAECVLRLGFENISIVDGDVVEMTNLNRQNYIKDDIGKFKVDVLKHRLKSINPQASIHAFPEFITNKNISNFFKKSSCQIVVNTMDFDTDIPLVFDEYCNQIGVPVLHPLNLGWGASVIVVSPSGKKLSSLSNDYEGFDLKMAEHIFSKLESKNSTPEYLLNAIKEYKLSRSTVKSPPQLSVGSWAVASMCSTIMYKLSLGLKVNTFPEIYFNSVM